MKKEIRISIDLMGGTGAPHCVIEGLENICTKYEDIRFVLYGRESDVSHLLGKTVLLKGRSTFINCDDVVSDYEQPVKALKSGKKSSMWAAVNAVKNKEADVCISSGSTGALMVMAKMVLGSLPGIKRPAIVSIYPNIKHGSVMLDFGANTECDEHTLLQFAVMGCCYARIMLKKSEPSVGILNVGVEEYKGRDIDKRAFKLLKDSTLNFYGFIEGNDLSAGTVDVVVTDGFTGNIVLKTSEGVGKICRTYMKEAFMSSLLSKIGAFFAKSALKSLAKKVDPRNYNGAMFIGLNGIVIKSHGSSDSFAFSNAVEAAIKLSKQCINDDISNMLESYYTEEVHPSIISKIKNKLGFKQ
jgi:phosphate acyltransferase